MSVLVKPCLLAVLLSAAALAMIGVAGANTEFVPFGADWRYLDDGSDQGTAWQAREFDDSGWAIGPAEFGYGEGDEATVVSYGGVRTEKFVTTYFRTSFTVDDPAALPGLRVELMRDDGAVVFFNGTEIGRSHMPEGEINYETFALSSLGGTAERAIVILTAEPELFVAGENVLAVEVHQGNRSNSDLSFNLRATDVVAPVAPELGARALASPSQVGAALILGSTNLSATDCDSDDAALMFSVSDRVACRLELAGAPGEVVRDFTQQQVATGQVMFVRETPGDFAPPQGVGAGGELNSLREISGLVPSFQDAGILWAIEDSDNAASLLAIETNGSYRGAWALAGATNVDWEDIAAATVEGVPYLFVGDIGDNGASRTNLAIYRVREPVVGAAAGGVVPAGDVLRIDLQYPESPSGESGIGSPGVPARRDAEAMLADPANGDIYVISKRETRARVFRLPYQASYIGVQTLEYVGEMPAVIPDTVFGSAFTSTGADISRDGLQVVVRNYGHVFHFERPDLTTSLADLLTGDAAEVLPADDLGTIQWESIAFSSDGTQLFSIGEDESGTQGVKFIRYNRLPPDAPPAFSVTVSDGLLSDGPHPVLISMGSIEGWRAEHFTPAELADEGLEGPLWGDEADPDRDGLPNQVEYALGLVPRIADAEGAIDSEIEGGEFAVRYGRRADRGDVVLRAQASADLATWIDLDAVTESVDGNVETRRASLAFDGETRRWVRLAAERLP